MSISPIEVKNITLTNGRQMPVFGLGTFLTKNQAEMTNLLRTAFDTGYRHIDTALFYENEKLIGDSLQAIFSEGKYKREDLFIATKLLGAKGTSVEEILRGQLKDLQLDYIDLLYLHFPFTAPGDGLTSWTHKPIHQVWAEFEDVYNKNLTKALGVSNFNTMAVVDLLSYCKIKPVVNQIELHVFLQQTRLVEFLITVKVYPVAYCPLARFTTANENHEIQAIAKSNHSTVSQVLLAFLLNQGITVIPKTEKISRLRENLESVNIKLSEQDMQKLKNLNSNSRIVDSKEGFEWFFKGVPLFD